MHVLHQTEEERERENYVYCYLGAEFFFLFCSDTRAASSFVSSSIRHRDNSGGHHILHIGL